MSTTLEVVKNPVTTEVAAQMLEVTRWAVLKAIKDKRLVGTKLGRDFVIEVDEVERYRRERRLTGPRKQQPRRPRPE